MVGWCCAEHEEMGKEEHEGVKGDDGFTQCQTLKLSTEIDEFHLRHALTAVEGPLRTWMPSRLLTSPAPLPSSWSSYLPPLLPSPAPPTAHIYGVFVEALSPVFTALSALPPPTSPPKTTLTIHILLPTDVHPIPEEITNLNLYEEILHLTPSLTALSLFLISPAVPSQLNAAPTTQKTCAPCAGLHRKREVHWITGEYVEVVEGLEEPDLVVAFQPSMAAMEDESWRRAIRLLMTKGVRAVFTARTEEEANDDLQWVVGEKGVDGMEVWGPERNTWKGGWPRIDGWEEDGVWFTNAWVWGVGAKVGRE
ncbi:hypothetical protein MNV49_005455 [Pseudohyphozyma bogoriensis]|nr:hypothetical protein MNV49_005455 [Pseudohyphozyma bogoriensis]